MQERCLVITTDEGGRVIFLSCLLHLFAHRSEHIYTQANTQTKAAAVHVNELSMEQWWLFTQTNLTKTTGTKIEG